MKFVVKGIEYVKSDTNHYDVHIKFEDGRNETIYWRGDHRLTKKYLAEQMRELIMREEYAEKAERKHKLKIEQTKQRLVGCELDTNPKKRGD